MSFDLFDKAVDKAMPDKKGKKPQPDESHDPTLQELMDIASPEEKTLLEALIKKVSDSEGGEAPGPADKQPPFGGPDTPPKM